MEFFKKFKKGVENLGKAAVVAGTLAGPMVTDANVNQAEAQTVTRSVESLNKLNYGQSTVSQEYKKNFENWLTGSVLKNPKVISEIGAVSKIKTGDGGYLAFLNPKKEESSQITFSPGDGLPENLVNKEKGIEKLYMIISKTGITDKNIVAIFFSETEDPESSNKEFSVLFGYNLAAGKIIDRIQK